MDQKSWRWRRKRSEKSLVSNGRNSISFERNFQEDEDKDEDESLRCLSNLSERMPSVVCDCIAKDELISKHRRIAEQALAGQEMERAEAIYLKKELEKAVNQVELAEKKLANLNSALNDCTKEIEALREEEVERIRTAFSKANSDCEKERTKLDAKLTEANRRISNLSSENANLMKALICKERHIHDLETGKSELESELDILTSKFEIVEKENAALKYEFGKYDKIGDSETLANALLAELSYKGIISSNSWLDEILKVILEEHRVSNRDLRDLLEDIRIALLGQNNENYVSNTEEICGLLTWEEGEEAVLTDEDFSGQEIERLRKEVESLKESKGVIEEQMENLRLINEDLNTQLTVAKSKINEVMHKLLSLEVELDHRNNCCDELEATCLELQLQLETISRKASPNTYIDEVAKQLFEQALCPTTTKKSLNVGYSLRERMQADAYAEKQHQLKQDNVNSPEKSIVPYTGAKSIPNNPKTTSPEQVGSLAIVSSKTGSTGFGFIRKMFLRRKKRCNKIERNTSVMMRQRDVLLLV